VNRVPRRFACLMIAGLCLGAWVLSQSFTLSLPIDLRIVDAATRAPVQGAIALALWKSYAVTLGGANSGPELMAAAAQSDSSGWVHLPMRFAGHRPFAPFSRYARDWDYFPQLIIAHREHQLHLEISSWLWPYPTILLGSPPVAPSSLTGRTIEIRPLTTAQPNNNALRLKNDELAFTTRMLGIEERCRYARTARGWFLDIEAAVFSPSDWRNDEFQQMFSKCP